MKKFILLIMMIALSSTCAFAGRGSDHGYLDLEKVKDMREDAVRIIDAGKVGDNNYNYSYFVLYCVDGMKIFQSRAYNADSASMKILPGKCDGTYASEPTSYDPVPVEDKLPQDQPEPKGVWKGNGVNW